MWLKNKRLSKIYDLIFIAIFIILALVLAVNATQTYFDTRSFVKPVHKLGSFTYEIENGESGTASFPYFIEGLAPRTPVTLYTEIESRRYDSLLVVTVYTSLRLYADDELIYECGEDGSYPTWLLDPPTLFKIVSLPENASQLRFEYTSPSQRSVMSLPVPKAGSDGALLSDVLKENSALFVMSIFFLFFGLVVSVVSILLWRKGKMFLHLGLFAFATGCWSFGECSATALFISYPVLLYFMAFGGLFTLSIPLLHYGCLILNPQNRMPIKIAKAVIKATVIIMFILQLTGVAAFSKTMYVLHILIPLSFAVLAAISIWEYYHYRNKMAKRFLLPALILTASSIMEVVNYHLRFTSALSLFFTAGTLLFTLVLGIIGSQLVIEKQLEIEEFATKTDFFRKMNHALRTPLTIVSTNIQTARRRPEEANELLRDSQAEIMKMAGMIDDALQDGEEGCP